jgi:hypothetical protein
LGLASICCKQIQSWFLRLERIGDYRGYHVDDAVDRATVASVLDLTDIFQLIVHALDQRPLAQQEFIEKWHQLVLHITLQFGNSLQTFCPSLLEQFLADGAAIAKPLAPEFTDQFLDGAAVITMAWCEREGQQLALLVNDQM